MTSKEELLTSLRKVGEEVISELRNLPDDHFEQGRYENGWNGREILAHLASIEWTYPRLIDLAKQGPQDAAPPKREAKGGIGSYNDRQVAKRAGVGIEDLIAEFEENRRSTIKAVEDSDESLLTQEITSSGGFTGALGDVLSWVAVDHVRAHLQDIVGTRS